MIGLLEGKVMASDGVELILLTSSGIGYQIYYPHILPSGTHMVLYIGHIVRESGEELFAFRSFEEKKVFELLNTVRGIGPKSSYSLLNTVGVKEVVHAIAMGTKKVLTEAKGIGPRAATQIILDLKDKVQKFVPLTLTSSNPILDDTLFACRELGLKDAKVIPLAEKILQEKKIKRSEELVHLILKEI